MVMATIAAKGVTMTGNETIAKIILIITILSLMFCSYQIGIYKAEINTKAYFEEKSYYNNELCEAKGLYLDTNSYLRGIYHSDTDIICIKVADESAERLNETYYHEMSHYFVNTDYHHFCVEQFPNTFKYYCDGGEE